METDARPKLTARELREECGLSRQALAEQIGCSTSTIVQVEGGLRPAPEMAQRIADELGCEPVALTLERHLDKGVKELCARAGGATKALDLGWIVGETPADWPDPNEPGRWVTPAGKHELRVISRESGDWTCAEVVE